jgi:hypothetical protein
MFDVKQVGEALVASVKAHVAFAVAGINKRLDEFESRLSSIPAGKSAHEIAMARGFVGTEPEWIASLRGESIKGDPGQDADLVAISKAINEGISAAIAEIPAPKDGISVTLEDVQPIIAEGIKAAVEALPVPNDGKDADPAEIARLVAEAVAAIPTPVDGKSVTVDDVAPLIAEEVRAAVAAIPAPVNGKDADPEAIAQAIAEAVAALPAPKDGVSVEVDAVAALVADEVQRAVAALPPPAAGKDADPALIAEAVAAAVAALPVPKDGASVTLDDVLPAVQEAVDKAVAAIPRPKDGEPGKSVSLEDLALILEGAQAKWALDFERRAADVLQRAVDRMPAAKDGRDALDLDDIDLQQSDDGRTITLAFRRGAEVLEKSFTLDVPLDRGIYRKDTEYVKGDGVTFGGSFWIAQKAEPGKPEAGDGWRLAVKRGRDGKDLIVGTSTASRDPVRLK